MILAVYKPKGPTSHDIINKIRRLTGIKKVGHAGTLDPLAKGILVIGIGRQSTKKLSQIVAKEKEYLATIRLGATSVTNDAEGPISSKHENIKALKQKINKKIIKEILKQFIGHIQQTPPIFSALKIKGKTAYKLARQGQTPDLKPRAIEIKKIQLIAYKWPYLKIKVVTGPGVYIRSLARDIGQELQTGGYLRALERTRIGSFTKNKTIKIPAIKKYIDHEQRNIEPR